MQSACLQPVDLHLLSNGQQLHHQRLLVPQHVHLLVHPVAALVAKLQVKVGQDRREEEPHLVLRHVLADAVPGAVGEGLDGLALVVGVLGVAEPPLRDEAVGVLEVVRGVVGGVLVDGDARVRGDPFAADDPPAVVLGDDSGDSHRDRGVQAESFVDTCIIQAVSNLAGWGASLSVVVLYAQAFR